MGGIELASVKYFSARLPSKDLNLMPSKSLEQANILHLVQTKFEVSNQELAILEV
jgi:hypothetical protein